MTLSKTAEDEYPAAGVCAPCLLGTTAPNLQLRSSSTTLVYHHIYPHTTLQHARVGMSLSSQDTV